MDLLEVSLTPAQAERFLDATDGWEHVSVHRFAKTVAAVCQRGLTLRAEVLPLSCNLPFEVWTVVEADLRADLRATSITVDSLDAWLVLVQAKVGSLQAALGGPK